MIIIASKPGQLGNRLVVFANIIAFSLENKIKILNPSFDEYCDFYLNLKNNSLGEFPSKEQKKYLPRIIRSVIFKLVNILARIFSQLKLDNRFISVLRINWDEEVDLNSLQFIQKAKSTKFLFLHGWLFRDNDNIKKHSLFIRDFFKPLPCYEKNSRELISRIRASFQDKLLLIGVHIRQGDYRKFEGGKFFFTADQYIQVMNHLIASQKDKKVVFLICANEEQNRKAFDGRICFWSSNHFVEDMIALSLCDYIVGPPSTYTMWASFYGNTPLYQIQSLKDPIELDRSKVIDSF